LNEGIRNEVIQSAFGEICFVPGRLERIKSDAGACVFVDYAHTPDALKNAIITLRSICSKKIIVVFGCGGERDKGKRPKMGLLASELADYAIITSDNPRSEDPLVIINSIKRGIRKINFVCIPDRLDAIRHALKLAGPQDAVLIAGKGHENYQILKNKTMHFDDREAVRECLKSVN